MNKNIQSEKQDSEPSDWQLFTNNGLFNSVFPPSQRLGAKARAAYKRSFAVIIPISYTKKPTELTVAQLLEKPKKPLPTVEYAENFLVVWLHDETSKMKSVEASKNKLKQVASAVKTFTDANACCVFMDGIKNEKIFLIISGKSGESLIEKTHESKQLESIYLLSNENKFDQAWIETIPEIRGIFKTMTLLCNQLQKDIKMLDHNLVGFEISELPNSDESSTENQQDALFMYDQLFREIVLAMDDDSVEDIIGFGRKYYANNEKENDFLKCFENEYPKRSPIYWYTMDSFLYRTLNKALRTHDYDTLYALHVFIRHLHQELSNESKNRTVVPEILYRGQAMDMDEFERLQANQGGLLSVSNFFSTSSDREIALKFAGQSLNNRKKASLLIEITMNENVSVPVTCIDNYSYFKNEKEWLFSMGAVFRIGSCERSSSGVWVVKLTTTSDHDEKLKSLREFMKKSMEDANHCFNIAQLMNRIGNWVKSEYFYLMALQTESHWQRCASFYSNLGTVKSSMHENDEALSFYHRSLRLWEEFAPDNKAGKATLYNNIATVYYEQSNKTEAIEYYQKALEASQLQESQDESLIATLYGNIGSILNDDGKHEEALEKMQEALKIRKKIFPENHPDIAYSYNSLATTFYKMNRFAEAVKYAEKAVEINKQVLPTEHPQVKNHLDRLELCKQRLNAESEINS